MIDARDTTAAGYAARLASAGLRVFRLVRGTKNHFVDTEWSRHQISNAFDAFEAFDAFGNPERYNIAVATGASDLVVVDVDVKDGTSVAAKMAALSADWPPTYTVRTPTGGLHLYYRASGARFGQNPLAHGVDIRATNGYVLGPGSEIDGRRYVVERELPIAPLPQWLIDRLHTAAEKSIGAGTVAPHVDIDDPENVDAARRHLVALPAAPTGTRNEAAYRAATRCMDFGVSYETTVELMQELFSADPPLDDDEIEAVCRNAELHRRDAIGCHAPSLWRASIDDFTEVPPDLRGSRPAFWESVADCEGVEAKPQEWVIENLVPRDFVTLLIAAGGVGKTMLALQMLTCVATGAEFCGHAVSPGVAAGLFAEDKRDRLLTVSRNLLSTFGATESDAGRRLYLRSLIADDATLWGAQGRTELMRELTAACAAQPELKLLVLDGASDMFDGNEIARREVRAFVRSLTTLALERQIAIVLITHESKSATYDDDDKAASGSTAWRNSVKSALRLQPIQNDRTAPFRVLKHAKTNVGPEQLPITLSYENCMFAAVDARVPIALMIGERLEDGPVHVKALAKILKAEEAALSGASLPAIERQITKPFRGKSEPVRAGRYLVQFTPSGEGGGSFSLV